MLKNQKKEAASVGRCYCFNLQVTQFKETIHIKSSFKAHFIILTRHILLNSHQQQMLRNSLQYLIHILIYRLKMLKRQSKLAHLSPFKITGSCICAYG